MSDQPTSPLTPRDVHPALIGTDSFYVTGEDYLRIVSINSASGVTLTIVGRFLSLEGEIRPFVETHTPNTDGTQKVSDFRSGEGWLLNIAVYASAGTPSTTNCFVMLRVIRGLLGATQELATIVQGYCTASQRVAWPGSPVATTTTAAASGTVRVITGTTPAAGAEISETVPAAVVWHVLAIHTKLTTAAGGGARYAQLAIDDGAHVYFESDPPINLGGGTYYDFNSGSGVQRLTSAYDQLAWTMPVFLKMAAGHRIRTSTVALAVGDQWSTPYILVEQFAV